MIYNRQKEGHTNYDIFLPLSPFQCLTHLMHFRARENDNYTFDLVHKEEEDQPDGHVANHVHDVHHIFRIINCNILIGIVITGQNKDSPEKLDAHCEHDSCHDNFSVLVEILEWQNRKHSVDRYEEDDDKDRVQDDRGAVEELESII